MRVVFYRVYQIIFKFVRRIIEWKNADLIEGENSILKIPDLLKKLEKNRILLVTDKNITSLGLTHPLLEALKKEGINVSVFDETVPNPTIGNIENALKQYKENDCQALIAFGGGSSMDCAKGVAARVAQPHKSVPQMRGLLKVHRSIPCIIAVPTTAGTGSETTIAAVITDPQTHEKYAINDPCLVPRYAVLDPLITLGLPPFVTATTGLDALTHAVEAYIGRSNTRETREAARQAVKLVADNLFQAFCNGKDKTARANMLKGSYLAGVAFSKAYVGYVHALAHPLSGYYQTPHGLANAVLLPHVLDYYGSSAYKPLAELADMLSITKTSDNEEVKAKTFIAWIREMESKMNIPSRIEGIMDTDLPGMIHNALIEGNPLYPVPKELFAADFRKIYEMIR
jgi:alcohol dehydrogenase class IV